jgi:MFS family permease
VRPYVDLIRRNPDFRRVFAAELMVFGGDWFAVIPLLTLLPRLTGTGLWGGLVLAVDTAVIALLSPYAGTVADRVDRRRILITTSVVTAAAVTVLFGVRSAGTAWIALVGIAVVAVAKAFYFPAVQAALPNVVDPEDLPTANVLSGGAWGTMLVIGASLGGVLAQLLGEQVCFAIDAACMLLAAWLVWRTRRSFQGERTTQPASRARDAVVEGVRYLRRQPRVLALVTVKSAVGLGNGALTLFPLLAVSVYGVGPVGAGLMYAARGLGALVGPLLMRGPLLRSGRLLPGLALSMATYGVCYLVFGATPWFAAALALLTVAHMAGGANWVLSNFALQSEVPDELRGRVFSTDFMLATLALATSQATAGVLSDHVDIQLLASAGGAVTLVYALVWTLLTARLRRTAREQQAIS